jgi:hypothetical protein
VVIIIIMRGVGQVLAIIRVHGRVKDVGGVGGRIDGGGMRWRRRGRRYRGVIGGLGTGRGDMRGGHGGAVRVVA